MGLRSAPTDVNLEFLVDRIAEGRPDTVAPDELSYILREANRYRLLTKEEEVDLFKRYGNTDETSKEEIRETIIQRNLRLVIYVAVRHKHPNVSLADLVQEGNIGLMKAVERYDYKRGFKFSTYAVWWIRQAVERAVDNYSRPVRIPTYALAKLSKIDKAEAQMEDESKIVSVCRLAEKLGIDIDEVRQLKDLKRGGNILYLDAEPSEDSYTPMIELFRDPLQDNSHEEYRRRLSALDCKDLVEFGFCRITEREKGILKLRYGIGEDREHTLKEISEKYNLSRERVRQIEAEALEKLWNVFHRNRITT